MGKKKPVENKFSNYEKSLGALRVQKTSLKSFAKSKESIKNISNAVFNVNEIVFHTYQFLKLYCLYQYKEQRKLPEINYTLIKTIMKVLCKNEEKRGKPARKDVIDLKKKLKVFFDDKYSELLSKELNLSYKYLNGILDYEVTGILTNYENHIKNNFYKMLCRYINVIFEKEKKENFYRNLKISKKAIKNKIKNLRKFLRKIKTDIIEGCTDKDSEKYSKYIDNLRKNIKCDLDGEDNLINNVFKDPFSYLESIIVMNRKIERKGKKIMCAFPLRKSLIPKYMRLDTTAILHILFNDIENEKNKGFYLTKGNTVTYREHIWGMFFETDKRKFKRKGYVFNHQIMTDGIGCSLLFIKNDLYKKGKKNRIRSKRKPKGYSEFRYINNISNSDKSKFKEYQIIGIDPGKSDLIFATNGKTRKIEKKGQDKNVTEYFRYTQNQRRKETKMKEYRNLINNHKKKDKLDIQKIESELSETNSKSTNLIKVKKYMRLKNKVSASLLDYYKDDIYRKLKWFSFINKQRSESKMINNFKKKFGDGTGTLICIGDYGCYNMKYCEPTKGKSFRNLFKKAGYNVFLVDEYNTSKMNHFTGDEMEKFRKRKNVRPWKNDTKVVHGLLRSKNVSNNESNSDINKRGKHILMNRDMNGSLNIRLKAYNWIHDIDIPSYLKRT